MTPTATTSAPEKKSAPSAEITGAFHEFMEAFEAFKETNDERLGQIESRMSADVVTSDKLERIDRTLDELQLKQLRPPLAGAQKHADGKQISEVAAAESKV